MSTVSPASSSRSSSFDLYQTITDQVLAMLENGVIPWRSPILGRSSAGHPRNLESKKKYRGINTFLLAFTAYAHGYESSYWLSFKQAKEKGGSIRKGEKSSMVVFWKELQVKDRETGEPKKAFVLRYYNVWNVAQCDGIKAPDAVAYVPNDFQPIEQAEQIVKGYADGPVIEHAGAQAFYRPSQDLVQIPEPTRFASTEEFYSTLFHELSHSTGAEKRLNREFATEPQPFGSADYGKEELIAEMSAAFLCAQAGIVPATLENTASYLDGWIRKIKQDKKLIISSAGAAQRSADWILGQRYEEAQPEEATSAI